ncbi:MAG: M24 family metallopeptidase [Planctomycetota bacterium]|jgi:Xaa-Pro aminopeptidase
MNSEIIQARRRDLRRQLAKRGLVGLILSKPADVAYVTAFSGHDAWAIVTKGATYLITDCRYIEQAQKECLRTKIVMRQGSITEAAGLLLRKLKSIKKIAVDKAISVATHDALKKSINVPLSAVDAPLAAARSIKDHAETAAIRTAAGIAAKALARIRSSFKPGITEIELAGTLDLEIRRLGSRNAFETIVAFGANASRPHHQPGRRRLRKTDTILIDFGALHKGYCCDITRCFAVGRSTAAYRHAYEVLERAQAAAIAQAKPGARLSEVDAAARAVIRDAALPVYGHGTGHGIGLEVHEEPFLKQDTKDRLQAGQILTIEPGIYIPGKFGIRLEDDILITETGCRILTRKCPRAALPK